MLGTATKDNHFIYVAENEAGQIVGFADGGPERARDMTFKGELYAIYILNDYQRQGVGRHLIPIYCRKAISVRTTFAVGLGLGRQSSLWVL